MKSRPGHHDKVGNGKEALEILPGLDFHKSIAPENKEEGATRAPLQKIPEGFNGVRSPRPFQFDVGGPKVRIRQGREPHHFEAVTNLDHILHPFMRWNRCGDEDDFLEPKCLPDLLRTPEVTLVDGVECPPKKTDSLPLHPSTDAPPPVKDKSGIRISKSETNSKFQ